MAHSASKLRLFSPICLLVSSIRSDEFSSESAKTYLQLATPLGLLFSLTRQMQPQPVVCLTLITKAHESDPVLGMSKTAPSFATDIEARHAQLAAARAERDAAIAERDRALLQNDRLRQLR